MSKTLFNTNTFQSKTVTNSNEIGILKADTFTATNAILTNITNAELQAATAGVATNASAISTNATNISNNTTAISTNATNISTNTTNISNNTTAIAGKEDAFVVSEFNPLKKSITNEQYLLYVDTEQNPTLGSNALVLSGGIYQYLIDNYQDELSAGEGIDITGTTISFDGTLTQDITTSGFIRANSLEYLDGGVVTDVQTEIGNKQDILTAGDGIDITGTTISFDGIMSQTIVTSGSITGATMNYVDNGVVTNIQTEIERKQDILTNADNAGDNITISATGVISSTDTTYSDTGTGAILVDGTTISLDFSRTDAEIECPQKFRIEKDGTPQFLVSADPDRGSDVGDGASAVITIRGQRMNTTTQRAAQLRFENRDYSLSNTRDLFELAGKVTNDTTNIGGMLISNYADGQTRTENTTMSADGNWYFGGGGAFQDTYKVEIGGSLNVNSPVYRIPQQIFYNFNIQSMAGSTSPSGTNRFGEESYFNSVASTRTLGDSFCSINNGTITFSQSGFYKIRVSANSQTFGYDNRTAFGVYLNINGTEYWENRNYNFFGWTYTRNRTDGAHGNITLEDCIYIASSHTLQVRTKIDIDNLNFDNSLGVNQMRCYTNLQIERIATTDIS